MNKQVMVDRELLERMRDLIYVLAHREDSIGQDACSVGGHFPELLAQPNHPRAMVVPEGYRLVPVEPTPEMIESTDGEFMPPTLVYKTMLAAAPAPKGDGQ
jgi:hypothetical protein